MGKIWIAGKGFEVDAAVVRWDQGPRFDGTALACHSRTSHPCAGGRLPFSSKGNINKSAQRFGLRPALRRYGEHPPLDAAQAVIRQLVVHHDGCASAAMCFDVLHNERGLSCHFLMDNDGTIYQTMDLALMAYHAAELNSGSVGIELSNRGDAKRDPGFYRQSGSRRAATTVRIHEHIFYAFEYTANQLAALQALVRGLRLALPNVPLEYPQSEPGKQLWTALPNPHGFSGYLGHYHATRRKWDPGPLDFKKLLESARGSLSFPLFTRSTRKQRADRPEMPSDDAALRRAAEELYAMSERDAEGGFFPVGPFGDSRLFHGGAHLATTLRAPVFAPFPGRLMVARMGPDRAIGSTNFALLRHDMAIGPASVRFWSLYYHLHDASGSAELPTWLASASWKERGKPGRVVLLDEPIEAGELLGHVGSAGPIDHRQPQLHFEIFAADNIVEQIQQHKWRVHDGTSGGRFSDIAEINAAIDTNPNDGKLDRRELLGFFRGGSDKSMIRYTGTYNVSEWHAEPDWRESLRVAADYAGMSEDALDTLVGEQIEPGLWWTDEVARHARLPRDGVVYHFHPVTFLKFINEKLLEAEALGQREGIGAFKASEAKAPPPDVTDDFGDESGSSFVTRAELAGGGSLDADLTLEDLVRGFDALEDL